MTNSTLAKYELTAILKPTLDDDSKKAQLEQITQLMDRFGAVLEKVDEWGKRRLAYEIQKHNEGIYYILTFSCNTNVPAEIESRLRIMENLLRFLIVRLEDKA